MLRSRCIIRDRASASGDPVSSESSVYEKLSYATLWLPTEIASWIGSIYVIRHAGSHALGRYAVALAAFNHLAIAYDEAA